ncbi:hypothetical protein LJC68_10315 [Bacteroidales bacterium OttesenSCG-928-B11]|nr:hypothetical protein [Bacteroidales bacterium OttesenSCG-928-B11]
MIVKSCVDNVEIVNLANEKLSIDKKIVQIIQQENPNFSYKKIVADLGEYHAKRNIIRFFEKLEYSENRVSNCDLKGILKDEFSKAWQLPKSVNIEVKTRYWQKGAPHLGNVNVEHFDLLVFVSLNEDYSIHYISMTKSSELKITDKRKVIYRASINPVFATNEKFEPHK